MRIDKLELRTFRNYEEASLEFSEGLNVFVGDNAQGKTNALEAISLLALGKSHRTHKDSDFIQWGADGALIIGEVFVRNRLNHLRLAFQKGSKKAQVNGVHLNKLSDFVGHFQVVLFAPEDLQLVKGGPGLRRRFLDMELGQTKPKYLSHLSQYARVLQQRNTLLKQSNSIDTLLDILDIQLVEHAVPILQERFRFVHEIASLSREVYESISDYKEIFDVRYVTSVKDLLANGAHQDEIMKRLEHTLSDKRKTDLQLGYTTTGPHRDDLEFKLNGQSVHAFASQGQQRTIALAMRLAEIDFIRKETGEYPVLLLDDVLSELDDKRQANLLLSMSQKVQTILTTATLSHSTEKLGADRRLFHVRSGIIKKEG